MDVHDEYIPDDLFSEFVAHMPQVCVEVVLDSPEGLLLLNRTNPPRVWFWPGSRLYKGEALEDAAHRVADEELGIEIDIEEELGTYAHVWEPDEAGHPTGRHTVNVVYRATPRRESFDIDLDEQHSDYRFLHELEPGLHEYVRQYTEENDLL